jgi:hypothetical protein
MTLGGAKVQKNLTGCNPMKIAFLFIFLITSELFLKNNSLVIKKTIIRSDKSHHGMISTA